MRGFTLGVCCGFFLFGCAVATTIPWPYYGLQAAHYDGKLLAVDPKNDKDLSMCMPDASKQGKCIVMLGPDFYQLKADDLKCHSDLDACQRGR